jgi:hypothetical protein
MHELSVWAPPDISPQSLHSKVNEWMRLHPTKPPYERFIQDYISSQWPVMWHLKTEHKIIINQEGRYTVQDERYVVPTPSASTASTTSAELCAICHNVLGMDAFALSCRHAYHTMCIHTWLRRSQTCPMCRAVVCT